MGRVHLAILILLVGALSGCTTPATIDGDRTPLPATAHTLSNGWSLSTSEGNFSYEGGRFRADVQGDQVVLTLNLSKALTLPELQWRFEGALDHEEDETHTYSRHIALWKQGDLWPKYGTPSSFRTVYATAGVDLHGVNTTVPVIDPQNELFNSGRSEFGYVFESKWPGPFLLEPGIWRLWLGVAHSENLSIEIVLPNLDLIHPPRSQDGCRVVEPYEFHSQLIAKAAIIGGVVVGSRYEISVPEESLLLGYKYSAPGVIRDREIRFSFPDDRAWSYESNTALGTRAEPEEWGGLILTSDQSGTHALEIIRETDLLLSGGPKLLYCTIWTGTTD